MYVVKVNHRAVTVILLLLPIALLSAGCSGLPQPKPVALASVSLTLHPLDNSPDIYSAETNDGRRFFVSSSRVCNHTEKTPLSALARQILIGFDQIKKTEERSDSDGVLLTEWSAKLEDTNVAIRTGIKKQSDCVTDVTAWERDSKKLPTFDELKTLL